MIPMGKHGGHPHAPVCISTAFEPCVKPKKKRKTYPPFRKFRKQASRSWFSATFVIGILLSHGQDVLENVDSIAKPRTMHKYTPKNHSGSIDASPKTKIVTYRLRCFHRCLPP